MSRNRSLIYNFNYFIFDLDDTLYPEIEDLRIAYFKIATLIELKGGISKESIFNYLLLEFEHNGREKLFDRLINQFQIKAIHISEMLQILRTCSYNTKIHLFPKMERLLKRVISQDKKVFVLTNGNVEQQKNKVSQI